MSKKVRFSDEIPSLRAQLEEILDDYGFVLDGELFSRIMEWHESNLDPQEERKVE